MSQKNVNAPSKPNANRKAAGSNWGSRLGLQSATVAEEKPPCKQNDKEKDIKSSSSSPKQHEEQECNNNGPIIVSKSSRQRKKRKDIARSGRFLAMDCEMVGIGPSGKDDMLARVSIVGRDGTVILDKFVKPQQPVIDYRTQVSGVRPHDMATGEDFQKVQYEVVQLLQGKILVGHALRNDLAVLHIKHPYRDIRDTSTYKPLCRLVTPNGHTPSLKKLAKVVLDQDIQSGEHNSIEDARAAMNIYNTLAVDWESYHFKKNQSRRH